MEYLLRRHFVFTPLQNHSFLQVSGRPLPEVIHEANRSSRPALLPPSAAQASTRKRPLDLPSTTAGKPPLPCTEEMDELPLRIMLYCDDYVRDVAPHPRSLLMAHRSEPLAQRAKRLAAHVCGGELGLNPNGPEEAGGKKKRKRKRGGEATTAGPEEATGGDGTGEGHGRGGKAEPPSLVCLMEQLLSRLSAATSSCEAGEGGGKGVGGVLARLLGRHCPLAPSVKALGRQKGGKGQRKGGKGEGSLACVATHDLAAGYATQEEDEEEDKEGSKTAVGQGGMRGQGEEQGGLGTMPRPNGSASSGGRLLDRCCDVASPPEQVLSFLNAVLRHVAPPQLLGSTHNFKVRWKVETLALCSWFFPRLATHKRVQERFQRLRVVP